nr:GNAT family N-acetyltransferase [Flavihumibacter fluvii]
MVDIQTFIPSQAQAVIDLILPIQQIEFGVPVTAADQPDLLDIPAFYFQGHGHFWVALINGEVVGTIGLLNFGGGGFALRKMFVAKAFRGVGYGVAQKLWETAKSWVNQHQGQAIYLGTVDILKAAHRFYEKNGFVRTEAADLPLQFPRMAVDTVFYRYEIH